MEKKVEVPLLADQERWGCYIGQLSTLNDVIGTEEKDMPVILDTCECDVTRGMMD